MLKFNISPLALSLSEAKLAEGQRRLLALRGPLRRGWAAPAFGTDRLSTNGFLMWCGTLYVQNPHQ
jgi:hypothetical protein